jgi:ATP-binding cassette subfamily F protein 1
MLPEPTNHLDLEAVIFLESVLSKWEKTLVVVSHDQDFLDEVCQEIVHLDSQKLWYYKGNYSQFEVQFEVEMEKRKKEYEKQLKQLKEEKRKNNQLTNKEKQNLLKGKIREGGAAKKGGRKGGDAEEEQIAIAAAGKNRGAKSAESAILDRPRDYVVEFSFPPPSELTPPIIQVRDVHFRYNEASPWLFRGLNFGIDMSSRICICGPNGAGKSTLIGLLTQSLEPTEGEIIVNRHLRVAAYKQHFVDGLPLNKTPIEYLHQKHNQPQQDIRARLGRYGLSGVAHTIKMASLSGGQKARVVFADMSYQNPHIIIAE